MTGPRQAVAVIIAAWNVEAMIGRAIRSALDQAEVAEVIVVDDASDDGTAGAARRADDGSGRLKLIRQRTNSGPAAARNAAIRASTSPYIAVLDADDYFLPARFKHMFEVDDWDLIADNIAFVAEGSSVRNDAFHSPPGRPASIDLADFINGNVSRPGRARAELGFVKPLIARQFLERHCIGYDQGLRLGEDYALYAEMLAAGAAFKRTMHCGYVAVERPGSLSGCHRTADLQALLRFDDRLLGSAAISAPAKRALSAHRRNLLGRVHHRRILDRRREGMVGALTAAMRHPLLAPRLLLDVARDKLGRRHKPGQEVRYLFG